MLCYGVLCCAVCRRPTCRKPNGTCSGLIRNPGSVLSQQCKSGIAGYESLLTKHRTSSSEMPFEDSQAATIKARYGGETLRRRSSTGMSCMPISPLQDTKDRLYKVQKLLQLLQVWLVMILPFNHAANQATQ